MKQNKETYQQTLNRVLSRIYLLNKYVGAIEKISTGYEEYFNLYDEERLISQKELREVSWKIERLIDQIQEVQEVEQDMPIDLLA